MKYDRDLFYERTLRWYRHNTRQDGRELLDLAAEIPIVSHVETFRLDQVNQALQRLKADQINGAAVVMMDRRS